MKVIEEPNGLDQAAKNFARRNKVGLWYAKRVAKQLLVVGAVCLVAKVAFDSAVTNEVNKQLTK